MAEDIAPALLADLRKLFGQYVESDKDIERLLTLIEEGGGNYSDAEALAYRFGDDLAKAFGKVMTKERLPDGRIYWNIADRVVRKMLEENHKLVATAAADIQANVNRRNGIGLKAQKPNLDKNKVEGILNSISHEEDYGKMMKFLGEPVRTFSQAVVDETLRKNLQFQGGAGLKPRIVRKVASGCCEWCSKLGGSYSYPDVPREIYRRHARCRCTVDYISAGKKVSIHSKR